MTHRRDPTSYSARMQTRAPARMNESDDDDDGNDGGPSTGVVVRSKPKAKKPSMYKVIMLNDDYSPMEFVVMIL